MDIKGARTIGIINMVLLMTTTVFPLSVNLKEDVIYGISGEAIFLEASYHVEPSSRLHSIIWKVDNAGATRILQYIVSKNTTLPSSPYRNRIQFDSETGTLRLSNFSQLDQGTYQITVTAEDGAEDKASALVTLYEPIVGVMVTMMPNDTTSVWNVTLSCSAERGTQPEFSWTKDWKNVTETERLSIINSGQTLVMHMVSAEDCGIYTCRVANQLSNKTQSMNFLASPSFPQCRRNPSSPKRNHYLPVVVLVAFGIALASLVIYFTKVSKLALQRTRPKNPVSKERE
ncbi:hepatic and glial cell adhesion molecule-like [Stegostoma tigrinum]|uniref:hepatic and glial cell adhesion molecule-like n=1 Tax=Stegostoma tigrinum TaxID=3053191 RepID=UPI00202BA08E|nr:hepatic and glial cell adhesion molecule-like [Stegostoma tigrinum]XP_048379673.1 hepatic and glial cell adhesion molecule-like [Stegostoma tigrinum]XP_048379674.1 hepatic and glial cell adhesion molecule-like [Stegostoma tigrinum]XP_048379675.1 hepatic and glial cell adhesion molecule-like [Stegostoma tigrinum]XP_048379676.1 hepatic and glial cell adhesion molecule-like [Stegostoma tigrinum]XP_048379678.1 hepatic and glial cell adhesion molecule-like [Stegostoma tigrinum]XP_048379679.1 he